MSHHVKYYFIPKIPDSVLPIAQDKSFALVPDSSLSLTPYTHQEPLLASPSNTSSSQTPSIPSIWSTLSKPLSSFPWLTERALELSSPLLTWCLPHATIIREF